jgi:hypothetical protein
MSNKLTAKAVKIVHVNAAKTSRALSRLDSALSLDRPPTAEEWAMWIQTCRDIASEAKDAANEAFDWSEALVEDCAA